MANLQTIPTTAESLKIYLENQIFQTDGHLIRINNTLTRLEEDFNSAQRREKKMEIARLIDDSRLELENYEFRLDFLQTRLEELHNLV